MNDSNRAVFLSYASQDAETAKRICEALRAAGVEVWFDQNELVGGDAWDTKIRKQIADCALFMPVISANTQARLEGYFRLEWKIAAHRTHTMADERVFLLPIVIDSTRDADARVPAEFKSVQWTRLSAGETTAAFCTRVKRLLETDGTLVAPQGGSTAAGPPPARRKLSWLGYGWAAVGIVFALVYAVRPFWSGRSLATPPGNQSEKIAVARPADRALQLRALNGLSRERLGAADELLAQALKSDPTNAEVLGLAAQVDALMVYRSWDLSEERRQSAVKRAARAVALAPEAFEARRAQAMVAAFTVRSPESLREAEETYRTLVAERPGDDNVLEELGTIVLAQRRNEEAAKLFLQANRPQLAGNAYYLAGRIEDARRIADELLTQRRSAAALILKANVELFGYNNLPAAQAAVSQLTPTELREDDAAGIALRLAVLSRDATGILRLLEPFPHPFVSILGVNYPRQYWTGLARSLLNQPEAAQIEWRGGLRSIEERLTARPSDSDALSWAAMFHAALGQRAETEQALRTYANYRDLSSGRWDFNYCVPLLRLGERSDEVIARLAKSLRDAANFNRILYAWARYSPEFDLVRGNPQFEELLREVRPSTAVPFDETPTSRTVVDDKSVAVLAFANLSDDKSNEYFSDGISEELLNVLAKVPGLKVSARTSAFFFKGKEVPIPEIAKQLGVAYVVEGSVRKSGEKVRITAQLIKAGDGFHVWSETFTRDLKDVFAVQDEIAELVATNISPLLTNARPSSAKQIDPESFRLYLEGRALAAKAGIENLRHATGLFRQATERDPRLIAAWVQLARAYVQLGRWGGMVPREAWAAAKDALAPALALEPDSPEVLVARGWILRTADWKWLEAERVFRRAVELRPNDADMLTSAAVLLVNIGKVAEADRLVQRALEIDPLNPATQFDLGMIYRFSNRVPQAERQFRRALELAPEGQRYRAFLSLTLTRLGQLDEAERLARAEPDELSRDFALGLAAAARRDQGAVRDILQRLERNRPTMGRLADFNAYVASLRATIGDLDAGLAELTLAREARDPTIGWVKVNHLLEPLYAHPAWPAFLRSVGLADEQLR